MTHLPETKQKAALSATQKTALIAVMIVSVTGISYFVVNPGGGSCGGIFQQTAPRLQANLEIIENKGQIAVSRETIQKLSKSAQRVGLHLKTCCTVLEGGQLDPDQFQQCVDGASEYDRQVAAVAQQVVEAEAAAEEGAVSVVEEKSRSIQKGVSAATGQAESFVTQPVKFISVSTTSTPAQSNITESEPNNNILESNTITLDQSVKAEILDNNDHDFFKFKYSDIRRDQVSVTLQNQSTTLRPSIKIYDSNKSEFTKAFDYTYGANVSSVFSIGQGAEYYVQVLPWNTKGAYVLKVEALRAYDEFEPNNDVFTATDFENRSVLEANIMDNGDTDWYRITAKNTEEVSVKLENRSRTLRPSLKIYNKNKSEIDKRFDYTHGSDLEFSFKTTPGDIYYIAVLPFGSSGQYRLHVK